MIEETALATLATSQDVTDEGAGRMTRWERVPKGRAELRRAHERRLVERAASEKRLLFAIKAHLPALEALLGDVTGAHEDLVYRFYHQSYKVFGIQDETVRVVDALRALAPDLFANEWFEAIVAGGTGRIFTRDDNSRWLEATRPVLEAFSHARYFLEMAVRYGRELDQPPRVLPSGWAAVLYLYGLR